MVVGIAVLICAFGATFAILSGRQSSGTPVPGVGRLVPGVGLRAVAAAPVMRHIETAGQPPRNIVGDLTIPAGARYLGASGSAQALDQYDRTVTIKVNSPGATVVHFYMSELSRAKWLVVSDRSVRSGVVQIIASHAGSDGYEWLVGVKIIDYSPTVSPALAGNGQSAVSCTVQIRLQQQGDAS